MFVGAAPGVFASPKVLGLPLVGGTPALQLPLDGQQEGDGRMTRVLLSEFLRPITQRPRTPPPKPPPPVFSGF